MLAGTQTQKGSSQASDLGIFSNEPGFGKVLYHVSGRILLDPIASPTSPCAYERSPADSPPSPRNRQYDIIRGIFDKNVSHVMNSRDGDTYLIFDSRTTFIKVKFVCYRGAEFDALAPAKDVLVSVKGVFEDSVESSKTPAPCVKRIRAC